MLKKLVERITKPVEESDREKLSEYCDARSLEPMDAIVSRQPVRVGRLWLQQRAEVDRRSARPGRRAARRRARP